MGFVSKLVSVRSVVVVSVAGAVAACSSGAAEVSSSTGEGLTAVAQPAPVQAATAAPSCDVTSIGSAPAANVVATAPNATWQGGIAYQGRYADSAYFADDAGGSVIVGTRGGVVSFMATFESLDGGALAVTLSQGGATTGSYTVAADGTTRGSGDTAALDEAGAAASTASTCGINTDCAKLQAKLWWERIHALHECLDPLEAPFLCAGALAALVATEREYAMECTPRTGSCEICTGQPGGRGGVSCENNCNNCAAATGVSAACLKNYCNNGGWNGKWPPDCPTTARAY